MLSTIDEILWLLKDGRWHKLEEITEKSSLAKYKAKMAIGFLQEYSFIQVDENGRKARLYPPMLNFLDEIQRVEKKEILSNKGLEGTVSSNKFVSLRRSVEEV